MRNWMLLPLLAAALHAAIVRGTVVENLTGHAIARAKVDIQPVPGTPGKALSTRTDTFGTFQFSEPPGLYLLQASRTPFMPAQYGQKRWNSAGTPFLVTETDTVFLTVRLIRFAAITGTVVDENDVGQPQFKVAAYRNTRPIELAADAIADERGQYRIFGLLPGSYLVRTAGNQLEGSQYKPTFSKDTEVVEQGQVVDVSAEQESSQINVRPLFGQLYKLAVTADPTDPDGEPVTITLVSDLGRQVIHGTSHTFTGLPEGDYEVFGEAPGRGGQQGDYVHISLGHDSGATLKLRKADISVQFDGVPDQLMDKGPGRVLARRKDLAGWHDEEVLKISNHRANLALGPWELAVEPPPGYYVSGFAGPGQYRPAENAAGWNEIRVSSDGSVRFTFSGGASSVHGAVTDSDGAPAVGAPVYLEQTDLELPRRLHSPAVTITDLRGQYRFTGLAPGSYRVLSTFEYQTPDSETMVNCHAAEFRIDTQTDVAKDLPLYVIP